MKTVNVIKSSEKWLGSILVQVLSLTLVVCRRTLSAVSAASIICNLPRLNTRQTDRRLLAVHIPYHAASSTMWKEGQSRTCTTSKRFSNSATTRGRDPLLSPSPSCYSTCTSTRHYTLALSTRSRRLIKISVWSAIGYRLSVNPENGEVLNTKHTGTCTSSISSLPSWNETLSRLPCCIRLQIASIQTRYNVSTLHYSIERISALRSSVTSTVAESSKWNIHYRFP